MTELPTFSVTPQRVMGMGVDMVRLAPYLRYACWIGGAFRAIRGDAVKEDGRACAAKVGVKARNLMH